MSAKAALFRTRRVAPAWRALLVAVLALAGMSQVVRANDDLLPRAATTDSSRHGSRALSAELQDRLRVVPYDQPALRRLAAHARDLGEADAAHRLIGLAGQLGWRDSGTQLMLIEDAAARRDTGGAIPHIDALLRRKPDLAPVLMPVLHTAAAGDSGRAALLARLDADPSWRGTFFDRVDLIPAQYREAHERLLARLSSRRSLATETELVPYLAWLADNGEPRRARSFWAALTHAAGGLVLDPEFARIDPASPGRPIPNPFEWTVYHVPGVDLRMTAESRNPSARRLLVDTDGSAFGDILAQRLVLPAGRFRLVVATPSPGLLMDGALRWSIQCLPSGSMLASDNRRTATGWQQSFEVPATHCESQKLSLDARRADAPAFGAIRIEKVTVEPEPLTARQGA